MTTKTDIRQLISRDTLARLTGAAGSQLDDIVRAINAQTTPPLALSFSGLVVTVGNITSQNPDTLVNRVASPIAGTIPTFTSGTVTFPSASGGNAVPSSGSNLAITVSSGNFIKVQLALNSAGNFVLAAGTQGASAAAATLPALSGDILLLGYVLVKNTAGTLSINGIFEYPYNVGNVTPTSTQTIQNKTFDSTDTATGIRMASFTPDGTNTLTAPAVTDTLAGVTAAQTLSNKTQQTLVGTVVSDSTTTGAQATLTGADITDVVVRLTNASLVSVSGIPAGSSGQLVIVENQTGTTITILDNDTGASAANRIRVGTGGTPVTMPNTATFMFLYDATTSRWMMMGGSGSGTGNANTILETLKNQLVDSPYQLLTTNIIATAAGTLQSALTGAIYDVVTNTIKFTADGQTAVSTNMLDANEFLPQGVLVGGIDLSAFWNLGSSFQVPTSKSFTYAAASVSNTSSTVTLTIPNHGLTAGKKIYVQTSTAIGGISAANLSSNSVTIAVPDANTITYTAGASATSTATGTVDFVVTGFVYLASRDGGNNYFPVAMSRVGTTEAFSGSLQWGLSQTTEATSSTLVNNTATGFNSALAGSNQAVGQKFVVPANTNWVVNSFAFTVASIAGTPIGNIIPQIIKDSSGNPSTNGSDILASGNPVAASSITTGSRTYSIPTTVLTSGTYWLVLRADATFQSAGGGNGFLFTFGSSIGSLNSTLVSGTWGSTSNVAFVTSLIGYTQDLRLKIFSASDTSLTYPVGLDGYGLFYNLQNSGVTGATKKTQRFVFNSVTDNSNSFTITTFTPDPDLLNCYWVEGGQVFKAPSFAVQGNTVVFPANTFNQGGVSQTITLIFDQNTGGAFDNSDLNAQLLATNHLGSTNGAIDKSSAGRGILLRNAAGTLVELMIDANNNIKIITTS